MSESIEDLKAQIRCAEETLKAWFDTSKRAKEQIIPALTDALSGYLRTCRCGGMPDEQSSLVEDVLSDFLRRHAGEVVTPIVEALAGERSAALASTAGAGAGDWVTVPREPTPEMLKAAAATPGMSEIDHLAQHHAQRTGKDFLRWPERGERPPLVQAWQAMLSAVPASPRSGARDPFIPGYLDDRYKRGDLPNLNAPASSLPEVPVGHSMEVRTCLASAPLAGPTEREAGMPDPYDARHATACRAAEAELRDWAHRGMLSLDGLTLGLPEAVAVAVMNALSQRGGAGRSERAVEIKELSDRAAPSPWGDAHLMGNPNDRILASRLVNDLRSGELVHWSEIAGRSDKGAGEEEGRKLYIVRGEVGVYSDRREWLVKAFWRLEDAEAFAVQAQEKTRIAAKAAYDLDWSADEYARQLEALRAELPDPGAPIDSSYGDEVEYRVLELDAPAPAQSPSTSDGEG